MSLGRSFLRTADFRGHKREKTQVFYTQIPPLPGDDDLNFARNSQCEEYAFWVSSQDPNILICVYWRGREGPGPLVVCQTEVITDDSADVLLVGLPAAIIYRWAGRDGQRADRVLVYGPKLKRWVKKPGSLVLAGGLIVADPI